PMREEIGDVVVDIDRIGRKDLATRLYQPGSTQPHAIEQISLEPANRKLAVQDLPGLSDGVAADSFADERGLREDEQRGDDADDERAHEGSESRQPSHRIHRIASTLRTFRIRCCESA